MEDEGSVSDLAHIAVFAYNRPDHLARTLGALAQNDLALESRVTVFCDGPREPGGREAKTIFGESREDETGRSLEEVRAVARGADGFRSVEVVERPTNLGLAQSLITGISDTLREHESIIVLEDDLTTVPYFLRFMNEGLERYREEARVISVCGYRFPVEGSLPDAFFLPGAFCWGWGTWRDRWALYEKDSREALRKVVERDLIYDFDFKGSDPLTKILHLSLFPENRVDSWALRWMATACLKRKISLYPGLSLVRNEGFDHTGRHAKGHQHFNSPMADRPMEIGQIPVEVDPGIERRFQELFRGWRLKLGRNLLDRIFFFLVRFVPERLERWMYSYVTRRAMRKREERRIREGLAKEPSSAVEAS